MRLKKMVMAHCNQFIELIPGILCDVAHAVSIHEADDLIRIVVAPKKNTQSKLHVLFDDAHAHKKYEFEINFHESHAECEIVGLFKLQNKNTIDIKTVMNHFVPHCVSKQLWKGVMTDAAKAAFDGKIVVHPNAQKTVALLSNKNLLLCKTAEINTKPALEIYADDVKCSHGATVGCLDEQAIFYLRSRGITEVDAKAILVQAFVDEVQNFFNN